MSRISAFQTHGLYAIADTHDAIEQ